jgi:gas vesicle protein
MNRSFLFKSYMITVLAGFVIGYVFLHPASVLIFYVFEKNAFDLIEIVRESFSLVHLVMGAYFSVIGGLLGGIAAVCMANVRNTNSQLFDINSRLKTQNQQLRQRAESAKIDNKFIFQKIWPVLSRIENGVEMVNNQSAGRLSMRQSALLSITKNNIERLYEVVESLVLGKSVNAEANNLKTKKAMQ